jgi:hypothetical protein
VSGDANVKLAAPRPLRSAMKCFATATVFETRRRCVLVLR